MTNLTRAMKFFHCLRFLTMVAVAAIAGSLRAQIADEAVAVPVHFQGRVNALSSGDPDDPATVTITALGVTGTSVASTGSSTGGTAVEAYGGFARLRPGRTYLFRIDAYLLTRVQVKVTPPSGHRVFINGVEHEMFDWQKDGGGQLEAEGFFSVRLEDGSNAAVGEAAALRPGRVLWSVGLGNLRNGKSAGSLRLAEDGITANTFKPLALFYDHDESNQNGRYVGEDGEVTVVKVGNILRQVRTKTTLADIVANDDHSYYIRLFPLDLVTDPLGGDNPYDVSAATPLFVFFVENPSYPALDAMRVTKTVNQGGQSLVTWTQMTKQAGQPSGTSQWLIDDWVDKPAGTPTSVSSPVRHRWTYSDSDKNEHMRVEDGSGNVAVSTFKRYEDYSFGVETTRELYYEITGARTGTDTTTSNAEIAGSSKTTYSYYQSYSDSAAGDWHKVASISSTDGSQSLFAYCNEFEKRGSVFQTRRSHANTAPSGFGLGTDGEITTFSYDFTDYFGTQRLPTEIQTKVNDKLTARSTFSYAYESVTDTSASYSDPGNAVMPVLKITRNEYADGTTALTTITRAYREDADWEFKFFPGLPRSIERADNTMTATVYFRTNAPDQPFVPNQSGNSRVHATLQGTKDITIGTAMTTYGSYTQPLPDEFRVVAGKSSESRLVFGSIAMPVISEHRAYVATGWVTMRQDWTLYANSIWPEQIQRRTDSLGAFWIANSNTWSGGRLTASVDETGISQSFAYDSVGRVSSFTQAGATSGGTTIAAQTFATTYDAAGRELSRSTTAGAASLVNSATYDTAGRVLTKSSPGQGTIYYSYDVANRTLTQTLPTGGTRIETRLKDGRLSSVTGTAQVAEYYDYDVETDGRRKVTFSQGTSGGARTVNVWSDRLGRARERVRPGFNNSGTYTETMVYDNITGQLRTQSTTGYAVTRLEYNGMGEVKRRGLWTSGGTELHTDSDRITEFDANVESYSGAYWLVSKTWVYATASSQTATLVETSRQRLTGLSSTLRAESRTTDVDGNETTRTVTVDAANKVVTTTATRSGVSNSATEISLNGLSISSTGFDGVTLTRGYDALGRTTTVTNPRTGATTTQYQTNSPLVDWVKDASNNYLALYTYDAAGRVTAVSDAAGKLTLTAYNKRNQVVRRWGSAATPVEYAYNALGERTAMRTFRSGDFTVGTWPLSDSGLDGTGTPDSAYWTNGDKTTWSYDGYTGLLASKTDADNKSVSYTYNSRGQTYQRIWARGVVTTYGYDGNSGELTGISYSDGTPSVSYTYTRAGQIKTAADSTTGTRTFQYGIAGGSHVLQLDRVDLPAWFNSRQLSRSYDSVHRLAGFNLGGEVTQTYAYQAATSRFGTITTSTSGTSARTFTYGYNTGSLVSSLGDGGSFSVSYDYEANRDLLTAIDSKWSSVSRVRYDYTYNLLRRRATAKQSGNVFTAADDFGGSTYYRYAYNDRGEVTEAVNYYGEDPSSTSSPQLTGRRFGYNYDPIGNRTSATRSLGTGVSDQFSRNALNQYTSRENDVTYVAGTAQTASAIQVTGGSSAATIGRAGRYWGAEVTLNNTSGPVLTNLTLTATLAGQGSGGADLVRTEQRTALLAKALQSFSYDLDGNMTGDGLWSYSYDGENRLVAMETEANARDFYLGAANARRLEFTYDYLNRRVQKVVRSGWNGSTYTTVLSQRRYLYDGDNLVAELSGDGTAIVRSFTWGLDFNGSLTATGGVGALVQITDHTTNTAYIPNYDGNGNIAGLLRASDGAVMAKYEYSPFGELLRCWGDYAKSNPFRFSTKFTDDESGLIYYGARFYSPANGRFVNRDPIDESGGLNLYGFCGNDGVNGYDYLGYSWLSKFWNKFRHTIISAVLYAIPVVGPILGTIYNTVVGYTYGGIRGAIVALASSSYGGQYLGNTLQGAAKAYGISRQFRHGNFFDNLWNYYANSAVSYASYNVATSAYQGQLPAMKLETFVPKGNAMREGQPGALAAPMGAISDILYGAFDILSGAVSGDGAKVRAGASAIGWGALGAVGVDKTFFEKWVYPPTSRDIKVPKSMAERMGRVQAMDPFYGGKPEDPKAWTPNDPGAWKWNGMHGWHAGSNGVIANAVGLVLGPVQWLAGVYHESPFDKQSFKGEQDAQGTMNHILDSLGDIVANTVGMTVGYLYSSAQAGHVASSVGNYIPGPGDPDPQGKGGGGYTGKPFDAWGQYPPFRKF